MSEVEKHEDFLVVGEAEEGMETVGVKVVDIIIVESHNESYRGAIAAGCALVDSSVSLGRFRHVYALLLKVLRSRVRGRDAL